MTKSHSFCLVTLFAIVSLSILNVVAMNATLFAENNVEVTEHQVRFWGPYEVQAETTLRIDWAADREVMVAVLNDVDYQEDHSWTIIYRQTESEGQSGSVSFPVQYADSYYVAVQAPITVDATLYSVSAIIDYGSTVSVDSIPIIAVYGIVIAVAVIIVVLVVLLLTKRRTSSQ